MNQRKRDLRWLSWIPAILMMIIIFIYSSKPAVVSSGTSSPIAEAIVRMFEAVFGKIEEVKRADSVSFVEFVVRKAAHITEYAILALCISLPLWFYKIQGKTRWVIAFLLSVAYACSDEFHQTFVEGRSGSLRDVGIDAIGVTLGCFLFLLWAHHKQKKTVSYSRK